MRSPIHLQLNEIDSKFFTDYCKNTIRSKSSEDLDNALQKTIESTERYDLAEPGTWLHELHSSVRATLNKGLPSIPLSPVDHYTTRIKLRYSGLLTKGGMDNLKRLGYDIEAPHLKWLRDIDEKINLKVKEYPNMKRSKLFSYFINSEYKGISLDNYQRLMDEMERNDFSSCMDKSEYIDWYIRSSKDFNEDGTLTTDKALKMGKTLAAWTKDKPYDPSTLEWLIRNYEIHPSHEEKINTWAISFIELSHDSTSEMGPEI